ncbi:hypothetical protein EZ456_04385 [Pedobacter psychrodurus]|uniref:Uncharacterized protein n=1 Tax=Pedobacter psychrodurus TaxID=2530456 RepID=A0A4R0Q2Q5_9SPHI|nr:hypothetical protein [Pedobacter psychrodurus]TCD28633.1 hypothetical protein EZ456_04385 [Pedobacter psychrodurus]
MPDNITENLRDDLAGTSATPDPETRASEEDTYKNRFDDITLLNFTQNVSARKRYSHRIFLITTGWLISVITILVAVGLAKLKLSDSVLIALLGTTTINVLGFFVIVIQYLFNKDKST